MIEEIDRRGRYKATFGGREIVAESRQPLLDAARVLLAEGHPADSIVQVYRPGRSHWDLRGPVGVAAAIGVKESEAGPAFRRFIPSLGMSVAPPIENSGGPPSRTPCSTTSS